jgi:DNA-binding response OmpR family regulator
MARVPRVLLIDDDSTVRQALHQALVREDFAVLPAQNGSEAMRVFAENAVDVVLLDLDLGRESGWDTFDRLKGLRPHLPVVVMSACPEQHANKAGSASTAVMEKPLDLPVLVRILNTLAAAAVHSHSDRTPNHGSPAAN